MITGKKNVTLPTACSATIHTSSCIHHSAGACTAPGNSGGKSGASSELSDSAHAYLPAGRKLQDTPDPAYFPKIQPRCTKSLAERQSHVFAPIELPAHQAVPETAGEHICLQMRWYPHSGLSRRRVMSLGFLCCNIAASHNTCLSLWLYKAYRRQAGKH